MSHDESRIPAHHGHPNLKHTSERLVLNGTDRGENGQALQHFADAVVEVVSAGPELERAVVLERLGAAMHRIGRDPNPVELDNITDKIMRGARSSLVIESDDGSILGFVESGGPATNEMDEPHINDPEDDARPTIS
ncbi:hypothetical protein [Janibacter alittae]|uniref:Uncharacterized protein n=1 Tax=Janibacter alittae TaxID=3115209 RepID=A0ABZ2MGV6_9MICO